MNKFAIELLSRSAAEQLSWPPSLLAEDIFRYFRNVPADQASLSSTPFHAGRSDVRHQRAIQSPATLGLLDSSHSPHNIPNTHMYHPSIRLRTGRFLRQSDINQLRPTSPVSLRLASSTLPPLSLVQSSPVQSNSISPVPPFRALLSILSVHSTHTHPEASSLRQNVDVRWQWQLPKGNTVACLPSAKARREGYMDDVVEGGFLLFFFFGILLLTVSSSFSSFSRSLASLLNLYRVTGRTQVGM